MLTDLKLVDAPTPGAAVIFDFNANKPNSTTGRWVPRQGFDLSNPELDGDIDAADPMYRPREIRFMLRVAGSKPDALAIQSAMLRALVNPGPLGRGWLRVQVNPLVKAVWFRTYRPRVDRFDTENVAAADATGDLWDIGVVIPCEAFAYGERVTLSFSGSTTATVAGDPTAATNPMRLVLPTILGEAPVPLDVTVTLSSAPGARNTVTVMSHSSTTARPNVQIPIGQDDGSAGGGGVITSSDYVGGSARTAAAGTGTNPVTSTTVFPMGAGLVTGRYRALLRARIVTAGTYRINLDGDINTATAPVVIGPNLAFGWVDLGILSTTRNPTRSPNAATVGLPTDILLTVTRLTGTEGLVIDHLTLVPVDVVGSRGSRVLRASTRGTQNAGTLNLDGTYNEVSTTSALWGAIDAPGTFPMAVPGAANALSFTFGSPPGNTDSITRNAAVTVAYYPRYALLGDGA